MQRLQFVILWLVITLLIILLVLTPIYLELGDQYQFYMTNTIIIFTALTCTRYLFFLNYHWFAHVTWVRVSLVFLVIPLILYLVDAHYDFQRYIDEEGIQSWVIDGGNRGLALGNYIRNEYIFFLVWAVLSSFFIPFKMVRSIWKDYKKRLETAS